MQRIQLIGELIWRAYTVLQLSRSGNNVTSSHNLTPAQSRRTEIELMIYLDFQEIFIRDELSLPSRLLKMRDPAGIAAEAAVGTARPVALAALLTGLADLPVAASGQVCCLPLVAVCAVITGKKSTVPPTPSPLSASSSLDGFAPFSAIGSARGVTASNAQRSRAISRADRRRLERRR